MKYFCFFLYIILFVNCSSNANTANQPVRNYKSPIFETRLEKMRSGYVTQCLNPLANREYSERGCAFKLLTSLERSHGVNYNEVQLLRKANKLFFESVEQQMLAIISTKNEMAKQLRSAFRSPKEAMSYFKREYKFNSRDLHPLQE